LYICSCQLFTLSCILPTGDVISKMEKEGEKKEEL
jgi:hypothetical protein